MFSVTSLTFTVIVLTIWLLRVSRMRGGMVGNLRPIPLLSLPGGWCTVALGTVTLAMDGSCLSGLLFFGGDVFATGGAGFVAGDVGFDPGGVVLATGGGSFDAGGLAPAAGGVDLAMGGAVLTPGFA